MITEPQKSILQKRRLPLLSSFIAFSIALYAFILIAGSAAFIFSMRQNIRANKGAELLRILEIERFRLETAINNEIVVAVKMSTSPLIQRYLADPSDTSVKKLALEELAAYRSSFASNDVFWISDADKKFYFGDKPLYTLDINDTTSEWYLRTMNHTEHYNINVNYDIGLKTTLVWVNVPVRSGGRSIGAVGTGINITSFMDKIYEKDGGKVQLLFFNSAGEITGAKDVESIMEKRGLEYELGAIAADVVAAAKNLAHGQTGTLDTHLGKVVVGTVPLLQWYSVAIMPDSMGEYNSYLTLLFIVMLIVILLVCVIFNIFINGLLKPLRRSITEAESASRAKSEFLAVTSHEIRTPMNSIMGFAELAQDSSDLSQIKGYLGKIADSTKWLLNIINDILDVSKIESGKMELERAPFNPQDIISRCQSVILPAVKEKELVLEVCTEPLSGEKMLLGDSLRLYQALMNLLSNAVKFTNAGGSVKLSTTIKNSCGSSATVYFEVKDSGIGMAPGQLKKVFDPFIQADSSTTRNYGGTGLGLAIVKNLVEMMGGRLIAESSAGCGSTFGFEITFDTVEASGGAADRSAPAIIEKPHFEGVTVLVCDDNSLNQQLICEHLMNVGIRPAVADNGKIGVDIVKELAQKGQKPFDLIFMDIFMPVMDGIEAARRISALCAATPIVAMTANVMASELEKYHKNGMPDCLAKPFTTQELWRVLLKYLTPAGSSVVNEEEHASEKEKMLAKLKINFVKNNRHVCEEIAKAIAAGDITLGHRLSHTLKGNAGQIGKTALQKAAATVEAQLKASAISPVRSVARNGEASSVGQHYVSQHAMDILETELASVIAELTPLLDESPKSASAPLDAGQTLALFEKLERMLSNINPDCVNLLEELRAVEGTEELANYIESYNFESALNALAQLKEKLKGSSYAES